MPKHTTFRTSLIRSFGAIILIYSVALLVLTFYLAEESAQEQGESYLASAMNLTELHIKNLVLPVLENVRTSSFLFAEGAIEPGQIETERYFREVIEAIPQVSGISIALYDGTGYFLSTDSLGAFQRITTPNLIREGKSIWVRNGVADTADIAYSPLERPWFTAVENDSEIVSTAPYRFASSGDMGETFAIRSQLGDGRKVIIAYDVLFTTISDFTSSYRPTPSGTIMLLTEDGRVTGLPASELHAHEEREELLLTAAADLDIPEINGADSVLANLSTVSDTIIRYRVEGEKWWVLLEKIRLPGKQVRWLAVLLPERDIYNNRDIHIVVIIGATGLVLLLALYISTFLAHRYAQPIKTIAENGKLLQQLDIQNTPIDDSHIEEIQTLKSVHDSMKIALDAFAKYLPTTVVQQLLQIGEIAKLGGRTTDVVVLFTDIADFTSIAETMEPQELVEFMEPYFSGMLECLHRYHGTVDKLIGDAIMCFWGAPLKVENPIETALKAVMACLDFESELNRKREEQNLPALHTRFGLSFGPVVVGNVGSYRRMNYTVLGDVVNLAARLESLNKMYGTSVLVSEEIAHALTDLYHFRRLDRVAVKGKDQGGDVYEFRGAVPCDDNCAAYEKALALFLSSHFEEASEILETLPSEKACDLLLSRARHYAEYPPVDWNGVHYITTK